MLILLCFQSNVVLFSETQIIDWVCSGSCNRLFVCVYLGTNAVIISSKNQYLPLNTHCPVLDADCRERKEIYCIVNVPRVVGFVSHN